MSTDTQISEPQLGNGIMLYGSNDPGILIEECARQLEAPLSDPLKEEEFLVQSRA